MYDPHSREPRGFAFVTFEKPEDAEAAIAALNGTDLHGRRMTVDKVCGSSALIGTARQARATF